MSYERIYSPNGEMFEVHPNRVADLVLNQGWTRSKAEATEEDFSPEPELFDEPLDIFDDEDDG